MNIEDLKGCFANITDDEMLRENGLLYAENKESKSEIERLNNTINELEKENNDLRLLYQKTYKHLFEIGNDELAHYFMAQIDECPTFYVEPIIDYKAVVNVLEKYLEDLIHKNISIDQEFIVREIITKLQKLKEGKE